MGVHKSMWSVARNVSLLKQVFSDNVFQTRYWFCDHVVLEFDVSLIRFFESSKWIRMSGTGTVKKV